MSNFLIFLIWKFETIKTKLITRIILDILEPTTFPTERPGEFSKTAFTETNNSDKEVPNPIIIRPIKKSETLNFFPKDVAEDKRTSAPFTTK